MDSEGLASEQVVVHCVPFPSSLTGAELEINRLLGVVWRNVSKKKKKPTGSGQRTRSSHPLDFGSSSSVYLARVEVPASGSCRNASRNVLLCGQPKTCHLWPGVSQGQYQMQNLGLSVQSHLRGYHYCLGLRTVKTAMFCSSCEAGRQANACGRPSTEFYLVSGTHRQAPSGNLVVRVRYRALPP